MREVYERWERDELLPTVHFWPGVVAFLGYHPHPDDGTAAHLVSMVRRLSGLSQFALGRRIRAIAADIRAWERSAKVPTNPQLETLAKLAATFPWGVWDPHL